MNNLAALLILAVACLVGGIVLFVLGRGDAAMMAAAGLLLGSGFLPLMKAVVDATKAAKTSAERAERAEKRADEAFHETQVMRTEMFQRPKT